MAKQQRVIALPRCLRFTERDGYVLVVKITDGPQHLVDRLIHVQLTAEQLNTISDWDSNESQVLYLEHTLPHKEDD